MYLTALDLDGEVVDGVHTAEVLLDILHLKHGVTVFHGGDLGLELGDLAFELGYFFLKICHYASSFPAFALPPKSFLNQAIVRLSENSL